MKLSAPLKVSAVASMLGWSRDKTLRHLQAMDAQLNGTLLQRSEGGHHSVTKAALRRAFPDWFETTENLEMRVDAIEDVQKRHGQRIQLVASHLGSVTRDVAELKTRAA